MGNLSDKQLELATREYYESCAKQGDPMGTCFTTIVSSLNKVAPLLQLPWDEPTGEEKALFGNAVRYEMSSHVGRTIGDACALALEVFVKRRNSFSKESPVDPRVQAIKGVLENLTDEGGRIFSSARLDDISKTILYWIDEVEK